MAITDFESFEDLLNFEGAKSVTIAHGAGTAPSEMRKIKESAGASPSPPKSSVRRHGGSEPSPRRESQRVTRR